MKNLDLNGLGVQEMNAEEMRVTDGGMIWLAGLAAGLIVSFCNNYGDFVGGYKTASKAY
jgi:hypothetical protein